MDRLQRKCAIASAGLHLLLAFILIFGPAFLAPTQRALKSSDSAELTAGQVFQYVTLPSEESRSQIVRLAAQTPMASAQPQPTLNNGPRLPQVSTTPMNRNPARASSTAPKRDARLGQITKILNGVHQGHSGATTIENAAGSDGQDDEYAKFVREIYTSHWDLSGADASNAGALTKVTVTIASSGKVLSSRILLSSGNMQVDETVKRTLNSVDFIRPFEERAKDAQRTYTINFNCNSQQP